MTLRSFILGLLGAAFVCGYTYFNDHIMKQTMFVGNNMPISVYGTLVLFLLFGYPLLSRIHRKLLLGRGELAVILAMTLVACAIPGSNLLRIFSSALVLPHRYVQTEPGWEKQEIMDYAPEEMFADVSQDEETVLNGFIRGLKVGNKRLPVSDVPWYAWAQPIGFWIPIILSLWIGLMGLAMVVHRQWADHEHLPYPIVTFTKSIFPESDGTGSSVFSSRLFWIGFLVVLSINLYNFAATRFPEHLFGAIPLGVDFSSLGELFTTFTAGGGADFLADKNYYTIYLTVVAVAYFLPKDVSFSLGIAPFVFFTISGFLVTYNIANSGWIGGWPLGIQRDGMFTMGAYFALLLVILYTGRRYYLSVFSRALGIGRGDQAEPSAIWGARVFLASILLFIGYLVVQVGLDWLLAVLFAFGCVGIYLVMGRLIAETGLFFVATVGSPATVLWAFFGAKAIGPEGLLLMFMLCVVLFYDTRESLMPFVVNAMKLTDDCKVKVGKTMGAGIAALLIGLAVGIPVTLYAQYSNGIDITQWHNDQPKVPFNETIGAIQRLEAQGQLDVAGAETGLGLLTQISIHKQGAILFAVAFVLVLIFSACRLRFAKWPIHPVLFLVWCSYPGRCFAQSFFIGWFIKAMVTRYGGATIYQAIKPLMFGIIAGEMLGGMLPMLISLIQYLVPGGQLPTEFGIMPG